MPAGTSCKKTGKLSVVACRGSLWLKSFGSGRLLHMAARKPLANRGPQRGSPAGVVVRNNHLEEAMALLIRNQAAFVEQIARNDQERLALKEWQHKTEVWQHRTENWQRKTEDWQRETEAWERKIEDWQRNALERFDKIEERLAKIEISLIELPKTLVQTILDQIPKIRKEIGFKTRV